MLKEQQANIFLLHGDDSFRVGQELTKLKKRLKVKFPEANLVHLKAKDDVQTVLFGVSLFADEKLVLLDLDEYSLDELLVVLGEEAIPQFIQLIIYKFGKLDRRTKAYKTLEKIAGETKEIEAFSPWKEAEIVAWVNELAQSKDVKIEKLATQKLVEFYGQDTASINSELERLLAFSGGNSIKLSDIEKVSKAQYNLFDLADDLVGGNFGGFSKKLKQLTYFQNPLPIIAGLQTVFRSYLQIKDLQEQNLSSNEIAKLTGKNGWKISQDLSKIQHLTSKQLNAITGQLNKIEEEIKTGQSVDAAYHMRFRMLSLI